MSSKLHAKLVGALAAWALIATAGVELIAAPPQNRTISLRNIHTDETVTIEYKRGQTYVPDALERINWILRDWRRNEPARMDPALVDLLWEMHTELGSRVPINIISGYRSRTTNESLRRTVGGQASESRHILGKAADVQFPDIPVRQLRYAAMIRERGGVGYYPTSATPFIHVDTDRVRAWPRMPRQELALLFPSGRSQHQPAAGGPLTPADVRDARQRFPELATQVAAFHSLREQPRPVLVAKAEPPKAGPPSARPAPPGPILASIGAPPPRLVAEPRIVDRSSRFTARPSDEDRLKLTELATLASLTDAPRLIEPPRLVEPPRISERSRTSPPGTDRRTGAGSVPLAGGHADAPERRPGTLLASIGASISELISSMGWSLAPEFDEDHPEEVSYRPFPIAPFLTATPSPDDPALVTLVHPDVARTLELLDNNGSAPPMRLRPGAQVAQLLWAQTFDGSAIASAERSPPGTALASRAVRTEVDP